MENKAKKEILSLFLITVFSTFFVWFPFKFLKIGNGMLTVFANYDGPNYIVAARTLYEKAKISTTFSLPTPLEYYPAHLPGYPLLIRLFDSFLPTTWAMLVVTLFSTIAAVIVFYLLLKKFNLTTNPFWLSIIFLFFPGRWLVVRSIGSPEPLFIFAILTSFYFFKDKRYWLATIFGIIAQITKTPGILLFFSYLILLGYDYYKTKKLTIKAYPLFLIPLSLFFVFSFYKIQTGDFLAYFHSGDNFHLVFPPFQSFITGRNWLGDFWLEDMIYIYFIGALGIVYLFKQKFYDLATFAAIFFTATLFISHRDLSRYSLPLIPFFLIAFSPLLVKKEFKIAFIFILIPVYLYAINFITYNVAPIADWTPYLK